MKTWLYSWIIYPLVYSVAVMVGVFNKKVRETLKLRAWKDYLSLRFNVGQPIEYWVHVASYGELEYAIPILNALKKRDKQVLVTYYSISAKKPVEALPSQFENVSLVVPLPHDGLGLMKEFVALVRKQGVHHLLLLKYELWPGLLWECNRQGIKVFLVDALKPSWFHKKLLHKLDGILSGYRSEVDFVQHQNIQLVGDTRVERVLERINLSESKLSQVLSPQIATALSRNPTLVCGSMWPKDSEILIQALQKLSTFKKKFNVIWVPHELNAQECKKISLSFSKMNYHVFSIDSDSDLSTITEPLCMTVMKKGILVELYCCGSAAFVGGGFHSGVHSVWEPALAGAFVVCGPKIDRSPEAFELEKQNVLVKIKDENEMVQFLTRWLESQSVQPSLQTCIQHHIGAAQRVLEACGEI